MEGAARVLLGTRDGAAAITVPNGKSEALVLLDTAFLAQNAPEANTKWLLKEIGR